MVKTGARLWSRQVRVCGQEARTARKVLSCEQEARTARKVLSCEQEARTARKVLSCEQEAEWKNEAVRYLARLAGEIAVAPQLELYF